jgi:hypothetical protein
VAYQDEVADLCGFAGHQTLPSLKVASPVPGALPGRGNLLKLTGLSRNLNRFSAQFLSPGPAKERMPGKQRSGARN